MLKTSRTIGLGMILSGFALLTAIGASAAPSNVAAWRRNGTFSQSLGGAVGTAGDFNCDGTADLFIGAPGASFDPNGAPLVGDVGWVGVWFGGATLPPQPSDAPDWFVIGSGTSNSNSANIGWHVAAGDVNGDGCDDLLIGEDKNETEAIPSSIRAYFGSAGVPNATADWRRTFSAATDGSFGREARTAIATGDVNGDDVADIVVGLPNAARGQAGEGIVVVWFGGANLAAVPNAPADPVWFAESNQAGAKLGWSVAASGSVNGDGFADIVAGARDWDKTEFPSQIDNGRAMAWAGHPVLQFEPTGTPTNAFWTLNRNNDGVGAPHYGTSVAIAGDLDGDGIADIVTGAPFYDDISHAGASEGLTLVTFGASPAGPVVSVDLLLRGTLERGSYGEIVASAGDVNGDGYADFLVGEPRTTSGAPDDFTLHGRAHLWLGRKRADWNALPLYPNADVVYAEVGPLPTASLEQKFGNSLGTAGDWNGDGFSDVVVGALGIDLDGVNPGQPEGVAFVYAGRGETIASTPVDTLRGIRASDVFGLGVSFAGDINHDGFTDIVSGAPNYESDAGQVDEGRFFVNYGAECGASCGPTEIIGSGHREGNQAGANMGWSVSGAGDINGDGYADVIAGAPGTDGEMYLCGFLQFCPRTDSGVAQIFLGGPSFLSLTQNGSFAGDNQVGAKFGYSVSGAGDVNGDGYGDVIVGAPYGNSGLANEGRVFLYLGGPGGLSLTWSKRGGQANARFGIDVAGAGDVNGDGFGDVIIGADGYGPTGAAFIFLGRPTTPNFPQGLWTTPIRTLTGLQADSSFGVTVASAGDVNRDGLADVVVGAPDFDDDPEFGPQIGMASVYHGGAPMPSGSPATNLFGTAFISVRFGSAVAGAGDVNGDGFGDLVVGDQWNFGTEGFAQGEAYIFHGSATGIQLASVRTLRDCPHSICDYGQNVAGGGDVNGDGYADVLIGAYRLSDVATDAGGVFVHLGNNGLGKARRPLQALDSGVPRALLGGTASGFESVLSLVTPAGRSGGKFELEVKPLGQNFDGANTEVFSFSDNVSFPQGSIDFFGTPGTPYQWRARVKSESPLFGRSRWISLPGNGAREIDVRVLPEPGIGIALAVAVAGLAGIGRSRQRHDGKLDGKRECV